MGYYFKQIQENVFNFDLFDEIGGWGVTFDAFMQEYRQLPADATIKVNINSPGGDVFTAIPMANILRSHQGETIGTALGIVASAATFILLACDKARMPENAVFMIHRASGVTWGNADEIRSYADFVEIADNTAVKIYHDKSGLSGDEVKTMMQNTSFLTAEQAKEKGFIDELIKGVDVQNLLSNLAINGALKQRIKEAMSNTSHGAEPENNADTLTQPNPVAELQALTEACENSGIADLVQVAVTNSWSADFVSGRKETAKAVIDLSAKLGVEMSVAEAFAENAADLIRERVVANQQNTDKVSPVAPQALPKIMPGMSHQATVEMHVNNLRNRGVKIKSS